MKICKTVPGLITLTSKLRLKQNKNRDLNIGLVCNLLQGRNKEAGMRWIKLRSKLG
jgi:hypothetical protein